MINIPTTPSGRRHPKNWLEKLEFVKRAALSRSKKCIEWPWSKIHPGKISHGRWRPIGLPHRVALEIKLGRKLLKSEQSQHICDNPPCCNGSHLKPGDFSSNTLDSIERGRWKPPWKYGVEHHFAKLNPKKVRQMRKLREGGLPYEKIAKRFGVVYNAARNVCKRKTWKQVL